jgi:hypothetical protein
VRIHPDLPSYPEFNQIPTACSVRTVGCLKVQKLYNWPWLLHKMIVMDIFYGNNQRVAHWLLEPGARAFLASAQQAGRRLFNMSLKLSSSVTSHWLSTCQFSNILGAMKTNSTLKITSYAIKRTLRTLATLRQLLRTPTSVGRELQQIISVLYEINFIPC